MKGQYGSGWTESSTLRLGWLEERRRDHEEYPHLWRDTQRQLNELTLHVDDLALKLADTNDAIVRLSEESRAADQRLEQCIESLLSAICQFRAKLAAVTRQVLVTAPATAAPPAPGHVGLEGRTR